MRTRVGDVEGDAYSYLGATQHHPVQKDLEFLEGDGTRAHHAILLDRRQDLVVPEASLTFTTSTKLSGV